MVLCIFVVVMQEHYILALQVGKEYQLMSSDKHKELMKKYKKDPSLIRPDITHQVKILFKVLSLTMGGHNLPPSL